MLCAPMPQQAGRGGPYSGRGWGGTDGRGKSGGGGGARSPTPQSWKGSLGLPSQNAVSVAEAEPATASAIAGAAASAGAPATAGAVPVMVVPVTSALPGAAAGGAASGADAGGGAVAGRTSEAAAASGPLSSAVDKEIDALGRCLTMILRHKAPQYGLTMGTNGYVRVSDLLKVKQRTRTGRQLSSFDISHVQKAVATDNKQRLGLRQGEDGEWSIRANQGHSIHVVASEDLLRPICDPSLYPVCVHGTYKRHMPAILREGLKRMQRKHVHFASGLPTGQGGVQVKSGFRSSCEVLIFVDMRAAMADGMKFFVSENDVVLTEGLNEVVHPKYFEKILCWPSLEAFRI